MGDSKDAKRKKDKHRDSDDNPRENKSKRARTRSRSPAEVRDRDSIHKRRRSRSNSYERPAKHERQRDEPSKDSEVKQEAPARKAKDTDMLNTRTGGAYIPPARLRMMQAQITDKASIAYQRLAWEALKKSIHGHINKINVGNIGVIIKELLKENVVRGRGLLCRSVIQAQAASPTFTNVYAALVSAVNSRFPNIGELLLKRLVIQFKRGFKRNDKAICISSASFIAHLVNQRVAHEILALELLTLLVETPTDDSVEVSISFLKECGQKLTEVSSKGVNAIFEMLRNILHEGQLDKRVQYMIEVMFQVWKDGFKDHPALIDELELVPEEEQFTHLLMLDDATDPQDILNVFKFDEKYEENEQKYKALCREILGSDADSDDEEGSGESGSEGSNEEDDDQEQTVQKEMTIIDNTETNLVALRRTIYLTINSSLDFEECAHKLLKMQLKPGQEVELCHMFLDCCAEQRTYEKFYGLLAQRFCNINRIYIGPFEEIFKDSYSTAHRLDTNRLRNVSKFFAHLLFTDSISWEVLDCVKLNEEDTTSSSRIYIKILFQELAEYMGLKKLNDRLKDPTLQEAFLGVFPRDNPKNTRFSINFFTSIGLGGLTDELREHLKQMPKNVPPAITEIKVSDSDSSSSSSSSSSDSLSSDSSSSDSEKDGGKKKKKKAEKSKDKDPMTPEGAPDPEPQKDTERWGHDGFHDTYGKDARRTESRPDIPQRDRDNFARPRDVRRNDNRSRDFEQRNDEFRDRRREENMDDSRRRNRDDYERSNERNGDRQEFRRRDDDRRPDREGDRSRRDQNERRDRETRNEDENDRRDKEKRNELNRRKRNDKDRSDSREDDSRSRRQDKESRNERDRDDYANRRDERNKNLDKDNSEEDSRSKKEDRSKRDREQRNENDRQQNDREKRNKTVHESVEDDSRNRRQERASNKAGEEQVSKRDDRRKKNAENESSEEDSRQRKEKRIQSDKDRRKVDRSDSEEDTKKRRQKKDKNEKKKSKNEKKNDEKRAKHSEDDSEDDSQSKRDKDRKSKRAKGKKKQDSDTESSDDDTKQNEKENRKVRKARKKKESGTSSESESERRRKDKRDRHARKESQDEGWDIRRGSSIRRETAGDRYWDIKDH